MWLELAARHLSQIMRLPQEACGPKVCIKAPKNTMVVKNATPLVDMMMRENFLNGTSLDGIRRADAEAVVNIPTKILIPISW